MNLSREQMSVVMHGTTREAWWEPVPLPSPATVPDWCLDADTHYLEGESAKYSNRPKLHILVRKDQADWNEEYKYDEARSYYFSNSGDGRQTGYYHQPLRLQQVNGEEVWATPQDEGFGGRHYHIKMKDGKDAILRGPWHGCPPKGYVDCTYHLWPDPYFNPNSRWRDKKHRKNWRNTMGYFGWYITEELFLRIMAVYLPHLRAARVCESGMTYIEPCFNGQPPKGFENG